MKKEVPGGEDTEVRVAVVIPVVVDIEAIGVEIADIDTVAIRINENYSLSSSITGNRGFLHKI